MGIYNINVAKCNQCGRFIMKDMKQVELLEFVKKEYGWQGNINNLSCPTCATGRKTYFGEYKFIKPYKYEGKNIWFACIGNSKLSVFIKVSDIMPHDLMFKDNVDFKENIENYFKNTAYKKIYYSGTREVDLDNKTVLIADYEPLITKDNNRKIVE